MMATSTIATTSSISVTPRAARGAGSGRIRRIAQPVTLEAYGESRRLVCRGNRDSQRFGGRHAHPQFAGRDILHIGQNRIISEAGDRCGLVDGTNGAGGHSKSVVVVDVVEARIGIPGFSSLRP